VELKFCLSKLRFWRIKPTNELDCQPIWSIMESPMRWQREEETKENGVTGS
jgi:hypothetical protein